MKLLLIAVGFLSLCLAWMVMYRTGIVLRFNAWMRERVFTDSHVLFSGQRIAFLLLILGAVSLFSGMEQWIEMQTVQPHIAVAMLEQAQVDFRQRKYVHVINRCKVLVRTDSRNIEAWELLVKSYWATGQKDKAKRALDTLLLLSPNHLLKSLVDTHQAVSQKTPSRAR